MSEKGDLAKKLFEQGYNCSQSVIAVYAQELGLDFETALKISSTFGGGMGRMREVCGAVSAMFMISGIKYGYSSPTAIDEKKATYKMVQDLADKFKQENGSIICRQILGLNDTRPEPSKRTEEYYKKRPCGYIVKCAVEILEQMDNNINIDKLSKS